MLDESKRNGTNLGAQDCAKRYKSNWPGIPWAVLSFGSPRREEHLTAAVAIMDAIPILNMEELDPGIY